MKMWMVGGYNDTSSHHQHHHQVVNLDGFNGGGRKLRPLIPRPPPAVAASPSSATTHSCNFGLYTASHLFGAAGTHEQGIFSHKINAANNFNKEEEVTTMTMTMTMNNNNNNNNMNNDNNGGAGGGVMSSSSLSLSRWNPTAEQVRTLEELYRRGTRTPSTDQIQRITAQLRRYGKIEGKNVFYWFQNHKARERQKRRRHGLQHNLPSSNSNSNHHHHDDHRDHDADADDHLILPRKEPAGPASGKQCFEAERTRSHYSAADAEECGVMSMQRARVAEKACTEHNNERNNTWHNLAPSSPSLIERIFTSTTTTPTITDDCAYTTPKTRRFIASLKEPSPNTTNRRESYEDEDEDDDDDDSATLQLFPMRSQVDGQQQQERDQLAKSNVDRDVHFFEFLPPKLD